MFQFNKVTNFKDVDTLFMICSYLNEPPAVDTFECKFFNRVFHKYVKYSFGFISVHGMFQSERSTFMWTVGTRIQSLMNSTS